MKKLKYNILTKSELDKQRELKVRIISLSVFGILAGVGMILAYSWVLEKLNIY